MLRAYTQNVGEKSRIFTVLEMAGEPNFESSVLLQNSGVHECDVVDPSPVEVLSPTPKSNSRGPIQRGVDAFLCIYRTDVPGVSWCPSSSVRC